MKRPTFFLSSTIYDFSDLRSAVKYFLEEQGCKVLASESNDFEKPLDTHSYQACLDTIHQADYFVLFVGSRVGGWYDEDNKISITQREYREAYDLHKQGKLTIINFVRNEIWQLREDRQALSKYLENIDIDPAIKKDIINHPSKKLSDAEFIFDFIKELSRSQEAKDSSKGLGTPPTNNWVHIFDDFKGIIEVLEPLVFSGQPIEDAVMRKLLHQELVEILRNSLVKPKDNVVCSPKSVVESFYTNHSVPKGTLDEEYFSVKTKVLGGFTFFGFWLLDRRFQTFILPQALSSKTFLNFDNKTGTLQETPVYEALLILDKELQMFNKLNTEETLNIIFTYSPKNIDSTADSTDIPTIKFFLLINLFNRWINIIELTKAIINHLEGEADEPFVIPKLREKSPIPDMNKQLDKETVTIDEMKKFLKEL